MRYYTQDHEWIEVRDDFAYVGITDYAQSELGEIVFVDVETVDEHMDANEVFGSIEAVKTVSDLQMPVTGVIEFFNEDLEDNPQYINEDPYGKGWIIKIQIDDESELDTLMTEEQYLEFIKK